MLYLLLGGLEYKLDFSQLTDILAENNTISVLFKLLISLAIKNTNAVDQNLLFPIQLQTVLGFWSPENGIFPRRYPYLGLAWSHDPKSYAGGSV
jgi:hypothetical protein